MRSPLMLPMDEAAARGRLALQRCAACYAFQYPPRELCATCLGDAMQWREMPSASGEVLGTTTLHHSNDPAFHPRLPVHLALVRLDQGPTALAFLREPCTAGDHTRITAQLDAQKRAVLIAAPEERT